MHLGERLVLGGLGEKHIIGGLVADGRREVVAALALESVTASLTSSCESFVWGGCARPKHRRVWLHGGPQARSQTAPGRNIRLAQVESEVTAVAFCARLYRLPLEVGVGYGAFDHLRGFVGDLFLLGC